MFYGGAAGGGKSDWLLMEALEYVDVPSYSGILFRESFANLSHEPDGLMPRLADWLRPTPARYAASTRTWHFPSGATLTFGYLLKPDDHHRYAGPSYQFIGFDESTEIRHQSYTFMFSRLRRLHEGQGRLPLRVRSASNPGGRSHAFFRDRFALDKGGPRHSKLARRRKYIPALVTDNPYLDTAEYMESLMELDPVTRERLMRGDWTITEGGNLFRHGWFDYVNFPPERKIKRVVRFWDLAATEPSAEDPDPDWTVGVKMGELDGQFYVLDVARTRTTPKGVEDFVRRTAEDDGREVGIYIENEPGAAGLALIDQYQRKVLKGYNCRGIRPTGSKVERAKPVSSACEAGNLVLVRGPWNGDYVEEHVMFPQDEVHDDQVDATSGAHYVLTRRREWKAY